MLKINRHLFISVSSLQVGQVQEIPGNYRYITVEYVLSCMNEGCLYSGLKYLKQPRIEMDFIWISRLMSRL